MKIILNGDPLFPKALNDLKNYPDMLFVKGNIELLNEFSIAVIGSRNCTDYGVRAANFFARELCNRGIVVVSGLARGIDTAAHKACIEAGGKTIAVLAGGFNNIYPKENTKLVDEIIEAGGAVITEQLPDVPSINILFPKRNRIVSALSQAVLVVEARENSGALITASISERLGRKVFCVPSNIDSEAAIGSNKLISSGAKCTICIEDILKEYKNIKFKKKEDTVKLKNNEPNEYLEIYKSLSNEPVHINEICRKTGKNISDVSLGLTILELKGFVCQLPNKEFVIKR